MRSGIVHHKSDCKSCVLPTADRNKLHGFKHQHFTIISPKAPLYPSKIGRAQIAPGLIRNSHLSSLDKPSMCSTTLAQDKRWKCAEGFVLPSGQPSKNPNEIHSFKWTVPFGCFSSGFLHDFPLDLSCCINLYTLIVPQTPQVMDLFPLQLYFSLDSCCLAKSFTAKIDLTFKIL